MSSSSPFILSVVGDKVSRRILQNLFFQKMGYQKTEIWENSINFPEKINSLKEIPHLVLLDTNVIPLDGYEMLKLLRLNTAFQNTMIAACTASVMPEQVSQLKEAGFDGLISKPIIRSNFPEIVRTLLKGQSLWYIS